MSKFGLRSYLLCPLLWLLSGCSVNTFQSVWHPVSASAQNIKDLSWFLIIMCSLVFGVTILLLGMALRKSEQQKSGALRPGNKFILWSGLYIPSLILIATLIYSLESTMTIRKLNQEEDVLVIKFIGHQFWWEVHYPEYGIVDANELYVPVGKTVRLELYSRDVIHSFWVPNVHGKMDMLPETKTYLSFNVAKAGKYRGQCAEFCGVQHALMSYYLTALPADKFQEWVEQRQRPKAVTLTQQEERGKEIFFRESCHTCHAVKDTGFTGKAGPDLTHLGQRLTLGAATIPNSRKNLGEWILHSQKIKPFNRMPGYPDLDKDDLELLLDYLMSLK